MAKENILDLFLSLVCLFFPGVISYTEYLFLLCILTSKYIRLPKSQQLIKSYFQNAETSQCVCLISEPHAGFKIAFNMFDADGNEMVDKREFLVVRLSALHDTALKMRLIVYLTFCVFISAGRNFP